MLLLLLERPSWRPKNEYNAICIKNKISQLKNFPILVMKSLDLDPYSVNRYPMDPQH
jgi:hypothetical protein